ncbi:hypothetical protein HPB49_021403 [Dermacentor silvarum]|uniref:Uncharacterized protein n=1 Tax=Dermacentor silvarum TaxID=543639 RepID=A0ACB8C5G8_DERSI|nr:hypothetical protein HPB49_021403 [Dermacentor silvarum]
MWSSVCLALLVCGLGLVAGDTPANCTYEETRGWWTFTEGPRVSDRNVDCDNWTPGRGATKTRLFLEFPNLATDERGNRGTWTLIYNQGFEVVINFRRYFAFSNYSQSESFCSSTKAGWAHDILGHNWACFEGRRDGSVQQGKPLQAEPLRRGVGDTVDPFNSEEFVALINKAQSSWTAKVHEPFRGKTLNEMMSIRGGHRNRNFRNPPPAPVTEEQRKLASTLPEKFDWRNVSGVNYVSPIRNQANTSRKSPDSTVGLYDEGFHEASAVLPVRARGTQQDPLAPLTEGLKGSPRGELLAQRSNNERKRGSCGSCYAFASMALLESRLRIATNNKVQRVFSPQDAVACSPYSQGCNGGFPYLVGGKYAQDYGVVDEECNPYTGQEGPCKTKPNCTRHYVAKYRYCGGYYGACNEEVMRLALVHGGPVAVSFEVYPDFQSYSGGVYHHTTLHRQLGARGNEFRHRTQRLQDLDAFLTGRTFRVRVGQELSEPMDITTGVPQVSVLSPFLFNMALTGLPASLPADPFPVRCSIYAEDVALGIRGPRKSMPSIRCSLQRALDAENLTTVSGIGLILRPSRAFYISTPVAAQLGLLAIGPPGRTGNRPQTTPAPEADTYTGYYPHGMLWTTIQTSDSRPELPQTFKSTALAAAVATRKQASGAAIAAADAAPQTCSTTLSPPATRSAGPQQGKKKPTWQPLPLPKPKTTDFVVVLKPRTRLSLTALFPENGAGSALIAHLGANANRLVTVVMARDQSLILAYTADPLITDKLIGELTVLSSVGPVPLFGYLRADTQDSCYGVVTWPEGEILHIRRLGTTNKVRLTFSGKVKPRYVTYDALLILVHLYKKKHTKHAASADLLGTAPTPALALNGTSVAPVAHGATYGWRSRTSRVHTKVRYLRRTPRAHRAPPPKSPTPPLESQPGPTKGKRQRPRKPRPPDIRASQQVTPFPATKSPPPPHRGAGTHGPSKRGLTPPGPPTERSPSRQGPPASSTSHPPPPGLQPAAQGELTWAARIRQGPQVSGTGTAASPPRHPPNPPKPPTPPTPSREQIEIQQLKARVASLTQAMEALVNRSPPPPTSTPSGPAPEAMDSAPSEQRDCTALLAPIEARLSNLEGQMASIVTTIEDRLAAAIQTVFDRIPVMIVAQLPQIVSSTRRPTTKLKRVNKSQMQRPLPHMAEADRQSVSLTATPDNSPRTSSGAPMDLSALLEATQNSNTQDGGPRS